MFFFEKRTKKLSLVRWQKQRSTPAKNRAAPTGAPPKV
jgi:hypothetical protein